MHFRVLKSTNELYRSEVTDIAAYAPVSTFSETSSLGVNNAVKGVRCILDRVVAVSERK